ncbi:MAG: A/G-specific adenine glycosylase, partial [Acidobacteria bacterium]|nr:A/G-specific adenine glycosylase [Acidobacteriota bacterium]
MAARVPIHNPAELKRFRSALLRWFGRNQRALPWRENRDPYRVWVSEIMLQQTRVAAVLGHYRDFLERFPDVRALARARLSTVLAAWSGLGYYRRARSLHAGARKIVGELVGRLPTNSDEWRRLPGIGRYTAAAIASIAFNEPVAVLDGNVDRILRRVSGRRSLAQKEAWSMAQQLLSPQRPGHFNQAIMELGALVCLPARPLCSSCPVARWCATRGSLGFSAKERRYQKTIAYALAEENG